MSYCCVTANVVFFEVKPKEIITVSYSIVNGSVICKFGL